MNRVSQHISAQTPETVANAHAAILALAAVNNYGNKQPYKIEHGISEHAEDFSRMNKPFGLYYFNGTPVCYINEDMLGPEEKLLVRQANIGPSGMPKIGFLREGNALMNINKGKLYYIETAKQLHPSA